MAQWVGLPPGRGFTLEHINNLYTYLLRLSLGSLLPIFLFLIDLSLAPSWWPTRLLALLAFLALALALAFLALALAMAVATWSFYLVDLGLRNGDKRDRSR